MTLFKLLYRSAHESIFLLFGELILYDPEFLNRNKIGLIFNKCDTPEDLEEANKIIESLKRTEDKPIDVDIPIPNLESFQFDFIMSISAINMAKNRKELINKIRRGSTYRQIEVWFDQFQSFYANMIGYQTSS